MKDSYRESGKLGIYRQTIRWYSCILVSDSEVRSDELQGPESLESQPQCMRQLWSNRRKNWSHYRMAMPICVRVYWIASFSPSTIYVVVLALLWIDRILHIYDKKHTDTSPANFTVSVYIWLNSFRIYLSYNFGQSTYNNINMQRVHIILRINKILCKRNQMRICLFLPPSLYYSLFHLTHSPYLLEVDGFFVHFFPSLQWHFDQNRQVSWFKFHTHTQDIPKIDEQELD